MGGLHTKKNGLHTKAHEMYTKKRFAHGGTRKVSHGSVMRLIFLAFLALVFVAVTSYYGGLGAASQKRRLPASCLIWDRITTEDAAARTKKCQEREIRRQDRFKKKVNKKVKLAIKNRLISAVNPKIRGRRIGTAGIKRPFNNLKRPRHRQKQKYKRVHLASRLFDSR